MNRKKILIRVVFFIVIFLSVTTDFMLSQESAEKLYQAAILKKEAEGDLEGAIQIFLKIVTQFPENRKMAAKAQLQVGICYEKLGLNEAEKAFQKVIDNYPDQSEEVKAAKEKLSLILKAQSLIGTGDKGLRIRQIWSGPDAGSAGKPSPDGKYLSYIDQSTGDLAIREIATGKMIPVTNKIPREKPYEFALVACWSPDGKRLAYAWFNKDNYLELRTIGVDGSNVRTLYQKKNEWAFPSAWSPDGKSIVAGVVSVAGGAYTSYAYGLISVEDGSLRILKTAKLLKTAPKNTIFSPDGRYVVTDLPQKEDNPLHDIFFLSEDGQQEIPVVVHPADDFVLDWIPGSDYLLFLSDRTGTRDAWMVDVSGGKPQGEPLLVRKDIGQVSPLGFSRDGSFFYQLQTEMVDISIASIDLEKRTIVDSPKKILARFVGTNYGPMWSPDGKYLAYVSDRKAEPGGRTSQVLWIRSEETGETREVPIKINRFGRPCWAPDGRSIFVVGSNEKTFLALYQVDVQTGEATFFIDSEPGANIKDFVSSPDGKSVFYAYFEFAKMQARIIRLNLETREMRELYRKEAPPDIGRLAVSPDGKSLTFVTGDLDWPLIIKSIPLAGGEPRDLLKLKTGFPGTYAWTPDGKRIIFFKDISNKKEQKSELWSIPPEGGEPQSLGLIIDAYPSILSLHPDGRRIAFSVRQPNAEIWVMENFLPDKKK
jgi:Tol biopolymer transport system component